MTFSGFLSQVEDFLKIISHRPTAGFLNSVFLKGKTTVTVNLRISYIETLWRDLPKWKTNEKVHKREGLIN